MLNMLVFFICFTLKKFELQLGMVLGLFAIFGILRYRTNPIPIREMTYLFIVIGIGVINALANKDMSYTEIVVTNGLIYGLAAFLERLPLLRHELEEKVRYEKIELIKPERHDELIADLEARTGLKISRIELGDEIRCVFEYSTMPMLRPTKAPPAVLIAQVGDARTKG